MKIIIIKSNEWYDKLSEPKRTLFFLIAIVGGLIVAEYFMFIKNSPFPFIVWASIICFWRCSYTFIVWRDWYKETHIKK